ncbi:hypothetical protein AJ80_08375 [Polytolypa hystricis UAMH7299]|uniref:Uncharacterized protein n=1 Tax=Polytolypa hystricis (strain UAMH7299) TaxID=1447883 RepID=A0A2B7X977_POLH7|nr:hypothetical protein AJ80_08375 [Polytolypa hystricis UAMH7299]
MSDSDRGSNSTIHTPIPRSAVPSPEPVDFMTLFSFLKVTRGNSVTYGIGLRDVATEPVYWAFYFFDTAADGGPGFNSEAININVANPPAVVEHRLCPLGPDDVPTFNRLVEKFRLAPGDSGAHTQGRGGCLPWPRPCALFIKNWHDDNFKEKLRKIFRPEKKYNNPVGQEKYCENIQLVHGYANLAVVDIYPVEPCRLKGRQYPWPKLLCKIDPEQVPRLRDIARNMDMTNRETTVKGQHEFLLDLLDKLQKEMTLWEDDKDFAKAKK